MNQCWFIVLLSLTSKSVRLVFKCLSLVLRSSVSSCLVFFSSVTFTCCRALVVCGSAVRELCSPVCFSPLNLTPQQSLGSTSAFGSEISHLHPAVTGLAFHTYRPTLKRWWVACGTTISHVFPALLLLYLINLMLSWEAERTVRNKCNSHSRNVVVRRGFLRCASRRNLSRRTSYNLVWNRVM